MSASEQVQLAIQQLADTQPNILLEALKTAQTRGIDLGNVLEVLDYFILPVTKLQLYGYV